jgi:hypothetical protein
MQNGLSKQPSYNMYTEFLQVDSGHFKSSFTSCFFDVFLYKFNDLAKFSKGKNLQGYVARLAGVLERE